MISILAGIRYFEDMEICERESGRLSTVWADCCHECRAMSLSDRE